MIRVYREMVRIILHDIEMVRNILCDFGILISDKQFNSFWVLYTISCDI